MQPGHNEAPLLLKVGASRLLALLVGAMHVFGTALAWLPPFPVWAKISLSLVFLGSLGYYLGRDCLRTLPSSVVAVQLRPDCSCAVQTRNGEWLEASLLGSSFVAPYLTILNLRVAGGKFNPSVVLLPDAVEAEDFRRLRVLLKWKCAGAPISPG